MAAARSVRRHYQIFPLLLASLLSTRSSALGHDIAGVQEKTSSNTAGRGTLQADAAQPILPQATSGTFRFTDVDVHYQTLDQPAPEPPVIVFLHGAAFTSSTWLQLGSMHVAHKLGYKPYAIDLPGFGKTRKLPYSDNNMRAELLRTVILQAQPTINHTLVLVSPSMSGKYAIPFLDRYGMMLDGWVALAPVGVKDWGGPWEDTHKKVLLLTLYGSKDPLEPEADKLNKMFARTQREVLKDAGHACYFEQPDAWHAKLEPYLKRVLKTKQLRRKLVQQWAPSDSRGDDHDHDVSGEDVTQTSQDL